MKKRSEQLFSNEKNSEGTSVWFFQEQHRGPLREPRHDDGSTAQSPARGIGGPVRREAGAAGETSLAVRLQWERLPHLQVPGPPEGSENAYYNLGGVFIFSFNRKLYLHNHHILVYKVR